jgi:class 3 adenylate cyclase/DNA-binding CsgD family transcriptional regulator/tetratricopeptide (TPR) repeat protein
VRTYLFADLRDYTAFVETHGDVAAARLLRAYRSIVRAEVRAKRGVEIKTEGDSFYLVFNTPGDAVRCALGIARRAKLHNDRHPDLPLRIGVGINAGEAVEHDNAYVGSAVILASRLAQQAEAGRSLVTETVRSLVRTGGHAPMRDLGTWKLKGVAQSVHVFEVETTKSTATRAVGPSLRLPAMLESPPLRGATGLIVCPELVQRESALAALLGHVGAAATGSSRIVALTGEAGVGKTRLAREIARMAHEDGLYVFGGRSHPAAPPYEAFVAALRPYAQARGTEILKRVLGTLTGELRRLLPEIDVPAAADDVTIPDQERRERFLRTIHLLLEDAASLRPVLLVLEDMHEADAASHDLLRYLASTLHSGICVLLTYRDEDAGPTHPLRMLIADLDRNRRLAQITLARLDAVGVERMTKALLPDRARPELARAVLERSEGVPFLVEELLKTAIDDPDASPDRLALPRTVRDSVQMRLARLVEERGRPIADLLEAAAVAGVPLGYEIIAALSDRDEAGTNEDLGAAVAAQLLERAATQHEIYQFRHTLTRDAIASAIPTARKQRLHLRVAEALVRHGSGARAALVARHFAAAGEKAKAVQYAREGAAAAIAVGAYAGAIDLLREATAHAQGVANETDVLLELAAALQAAGHASEAEAALLRARDLVSDPRARARIDIRLAAVLRIQGQRAEAVEAVQRAIATLTGSETADLADALVAHAELASAEGDAAEASRLARSALRVAPRRRSDRTTVAALTVLGGSLVRLRDPSGEGEIERAIAIGKAAGLTAEVVSAHLELARAQQLAGRWEESRRAAEAGLALARTHGLELAQATLLAQLSYVLVTLGRYDDARTVAEQAVALARPDTVAATTARAMLADALTMQGSHAQALALYEGIAAQMERAEPERRGFFQASRARALLGLRRLDEAWSAALAGVDVVVRAKGSSVTPFLVAAEVAETRRDPAGLAEVATRFERHFAEATSGPVEVLRAELAAIAEMLDGSPHAAASFEAVAERYAALGVPARAAHRRATSAILRSRDRLARAAALRELRQIRSSLARQGANRYVAAIDAALARRGPPLTAGPLLSPTELRVAQLIARGLTDERIGREMRVTPRRVTTIVARVRARLGVATRAQIASWVRQRSTTLAPAG